MTGTDLGCTPLSLAETPPKPALSPIEAEIIQYSLTSIPNHIEANITRTAYSPLVYEVKDFAVAITDPEGRLIAQPIAGIPLFIANALGVAVQDGLEVHGRNGIRPGDVLISNHAGSIGQHLNNVAMYTPIFAGPDGDELFGFMAVMVHWIDIGGQEIGSCAPTGTHEIFQEGIQFRSVKLWDAGKRSRDLYSIIESNTRFPRMLFGDIESQLAGCLMGRDMILDLIERYSLSSVRETVTLMWDRSEAAARAAIDAIPDGDYTASSLLDNDGLKLDAPVEIAVKVRIAGDQMTIDLSGVADQLPGSINSGRFGGAITAARIAFKYLVTPDDAVNEGSFRPLTVEIPEGKFLSAAPTAAMAMFGIPLSTVVDTTVRALVDAIPERGAGGHHASYGIVSIYGVDPRSGESYYAMSASTGGWGATMARDGSGPYRTMIHGDTYDIPVEVHESLYPVRYHRQAILPNSGGPGEFCGCWGVERVIEILADGMAQINFERLLCPPWGVRGGGDALPPQVTIERADGTSVDTAKGIFTLGRGDRIRTRAAGGGGFGDPALRDPVRVASDVRNGYLSSAAARRQFGVSVGDDGGIVAGDAAARRAMIRES